MDHFDAIRLLEVMARNADDEVIEYALDQMTHKLKSYALKKTLHNKPVIHDFIARTRIESYKAYMGRTGSNLSASREVINAARDLCFMDTI